MTDNKLQPLVSVCIPTYNRADRLARAIAALQASTYSNLEIIISDNASQDQTEATCRALVASDSRISYHRHLINRGPTHNFNFVKSCATGKYFLWHSDDDFLSEDYIERCVQRLEDDDSLLLVAGVGAYQRDDGSFWYSNVIPLGSNSRLVRLAQYLLLVQDNSVFYGLYRRETVADILLSNILYGDCAWMAAVVLRGRVEVNPNIKVFREYKDTASASTEKICEVLDLPSYHAKWAKLIIVTNMARFTVLDRSDDRLGACLLQNLVRLLIAFLMTIRFPFQKIYRKSRLWE